jgi:hypothetical protein
LVDPVPPTVIDGDVFEEGGHFREAERGRMLLVVKENESARPRDEEFGSWLSITAGNCSKPEPFQERQCLGTRRNWSRRNVDGKRARGGSSRWEVYKRLVDEYTSIGGGVEKDRRAVRGLSLAWKGKLGMPLCRKESF